METSKGVMNSLKDSVRETIVSELNTLTNLDLRLTICDWEANSEIKNLTYLEQMVLDLAKIIIEVREANGVARVGA
jgi:hypothetical protein